MLSDTKRRLRPVTAGVTNRKRDNKDADTSASNGRRVRRVYSARPRTSRTNSPPPPDLNPPEWPPFLSELYPEEKTAAPIEDTSENSSQCDENFETDREKRERPNLPEIIGRVKAQLADEKANDEPLPYDKWSRHSKNQSTEPPKPMSSENIKTRDDLKNFLSAAMDSVRFFLVTSSIGQANKSEGPEEDEDDNRSDTSEVSSHAEEIIVPRSELIIKNAALTDKPWRFSIETYKNDPTMLEYYTGFKNFELISSIFRLVKPTAETIEKWEQVETEGRFRDGAFRSGIVTLFDEFFMFLFKLRLNPSTEDLSIRFCMEESTAEAILNDWMHYLYVCFGTSPVWATRDNTDVFMPMCFKSLSPCVRIVVHVANVKIRVPSTMTINDMPDYDTSEKDAKTVPVSRIIDSIKESDHATSEEESLPSTPKRQSQKTTNEGSKKSGAKGRSKTKKKIAPMSVVSKNQEDKPIRGINSEFKRRQSLSSLKSEPSKIPDTDGFKRYKTIVIFQPTGAAAFIGKLHPSHYRPEDILKESGVLELLDECDDIITLDQRDELDSSTIEEIIHPYAVNYLNSKFLKSNMSEEELQSKSPLKAHRLKCMHWHVYQSIEWIEHMKIWDELAELSETWVKNIDRVWTISCLLSNFLPADSCLDFGTSDRGVK